MVRDNRRPAIRAGEYLTRTLPSGIATGISLASLAEDWPRLAGPPGRRSRPFRMEQDELVVMAETPAVAQQLRMRGGDLCRKIRAKWNLQVRSIRPVVGKGHRPRPSVDSRSKQKRHSFSVRERDVQEALEEIRGTIGKEDVLLSLARLMATYRKRFGVLKNQDNQAAPKERQRGSVHP